LEPLFRLTVWVDGLLVYRNDPLAAIGMPWSRISASWTWRPQPSP